MKEFHLPFWERANDWKRNLVKEYKRGASSSDKPKESENITSPPIELLGGRVVLRRLLPGERTETGTPQDFGIKDFAYKKFDEAQTEADAGQLYADFKARTGKTVPDLEPLLEYVEPYPVYSAAEATEKAMRTNRRETELSAQEPSTGLVFDAEDLEPSDDVGEFGASRAKSDPQSGSMHVPHSFGINDGSEGNPGLDEDELGETDEVLAEAPPGVEEEQPLEIEAEKHQSEEDHNGPHRRQTK